jgi:hypothetical protein
MNIGSTFASAMARASSGSRNLLESLGGSPLPRVSSGTPLPRAMSGTTSADAWAGAWTKFLDNNPDVLPGGQSSWGSLSSLNDLDKVVGLPPASASAQALAPADSVSEMRAEQAPPPSPVPPVPTRAIVTVNSSTTRRGAPRTSAGPPQQSKEVAMILPAPAAPAAAAARAAPQPQPPPPHKPVKTEANKAPTSRKRKAAAPADETAGLTKEEIKFRKKRTKIETPTFIPEVATIVVPAGGLTAGAQIETELQTGQIVKLTINASEAAASTSTPQITIKLDMPALLDSPNAQYKVDLRGGRVQWVSRKKLETILRNRRSAAACRNTVVDLRIEVDELQAQLKKKDEQIAALQRMVEKSGAKNVAPSPRTSPPGAASTSSQLSNGRGLGLSLQHSSAVGNNGGGGALPPQLAKSSSRSPRSIAEKAKARLVRTFSGGVRRAAPWY